MGKTEKRSIYFGVAKEHTKHEQAYTYLKNTDWANVHAERPTENDN